MFHLYDFGLTHILKYREYNMRPEPHLANWVLRHILKVGYTTDSNISTLYFDVAIHNAGMFNCFKV